MSVCGIPDWANELGCGPDPLDMVECNPDTSRFFSHLVTLHQKFNGNLPITVRHTAAFIPRPHELTFVEHESRIRSMVQLLCMAGALEARLGPEAKTFDQGDWLPTYRFPDGLLARYLEKNAY